MLRTLRGVDSLILTTSLTLSDTRLLLGLCLSLKQFFRKNAIKLLDFLKKKIRNENE